jgi:sulfane dehydrogenase subunit SoxC
MKDFPILDRREVLRAGLRLGTASVVAGAAGAFGQDAPFAPPDSTKVLGPPPSGVGYRSPFETPERYLRPGTGPAGASFTPLEVLQGIITPADLHFERHHAGVPTIDPAAYELMIHGLVDRPMKFTLADLKRFPAASKICFVECSGNGRQAAALPDGLPEDITPGQLDGLFSVSEWTGVKLSTLLNEVGASRRAKWMLAEGQDAAVMARSIPMRKAWDDAMVVYAQNGEAIRPQQGYPLRLLLPGWEGNSNVKWLRRLELSDSPFMTRDETSKYTDAMADGRMRMFTFEMAPKSLITWPTYPNTMQRKGFHELRGIAWSGGGKIARVDVSVDGGRNWQRAALQEPVLDKCAVCFRYGFDWQGEERIIMSRATDENGNSQVGYIQNEAERGPGTSYHNSAIRPWKIHPDGHITFAIKEMAV